MSKNAALGSVLVKQEFLQSLGLKYAIDSEQQKFNNSNGDSRIVIDLIRDGSRFEDDTETVKRPLNHFFDPLHDKPLTVLGLPLGKTSPDWALESPNEIGSQHYSLRDARDYLYRALTAVSQSDRNKNIGLTFQALGHVIHHLQDMSQPQHVRNDQHLDQPKEFFGIIPNLFYNPSRYEKSTKENLDKDFVAQYLVPNAYPKVTFPTARDFWHTEARHPEAGRGIAEFTNANFLSQGTNFVNWNFGDPEAALSPADYPLPRWNGQKIPVDVRTLFAQEPECQPPPGYAPGCGRECGPPPELPPACGLTGEMIFYGTVVQDNYLGGAPQTNPRASTLSIFDQDLKPTGERAFALNRFNFEATYPFLIPKAVAYSAGLLDFFFRGRLEVNDVSEVDGQLRIEVRNVSGKDNPLKNGHFELYYDAPNGERRRLAVTQNAAVGELVNNAMAVIGAEMPKLGDVDPTQGNALTLVYRGAIGQEEGIATAKAEVPLAGFVVLANYTPADGIDARRHIYFEDGAWKVDRRTDLVAGDIDWKGWYVNGRPTKVLTWSGNSIYSNGKLLAAAPLDVLGAALTRDGDGRAWVVAIGYDLAARADKVFKRPAKRSDSTAMRDPVSAPDGWQRTLSQPSDAKQSLPNMPWYFNGAGTEAQTLRGVELTVTDIDHNGNAYSVKKSGLDRLKYTSQNGVDRIENLRNLDGHTQTFKVDAFPQYADVGCGSPVFVGGSLTATLADDGDYIVGVDYRDGEELLVKALKAQNTVVTQTNSVTYDVRKDPNGQCTATVATSEMDTTTTTTGGERLQINAQTLLTLESHDQDTAFDLCATGPSGRVNNGNSTARATWTDPEFLDPRDPLAYYFEDVENVGVVYTSANNYLNYRNTGSLKFSQMLKGAGALATPQQAHSETLSLDGTNSVPLSPLAGGYCSLGIDWWWVGTATHTFPAARSRAAGSLGSWLVDAAGRVLVSLDKGTGYFGDNYGKPVGYYRYLTSGELLSVIPPAVAQPNPKYYPAGLIR